MVRYVVMGAGKATRMGQDKLAMPWGKTTILGHILYIISQTLSLLEAQKIIRSILHSTDQGGGQNQDLGSRYEIVVVSRKSRGSYISPEEFKLPKLDLSWIELPSPQPLSETIRAGLKDLSKETRGICFIPGDQVGLTPKGLADLTTAYLRSTPDFLVPEFEGTPGSPVFFHPRYLTELRTLEGEHGGKFVLAKYKDRWQPYPVSKEFLWDVDTWEEYEAYQKGR